MSKKPELRVVPELEANDLVTPPTPWEAHTFRLGDFPATDSERRAFIFQHTGFAAKPMELREWYVFNTGLNHGLKLGLSEHAIKTLSLMDQALGSVKRFNGASHMHTIVADSTAAHTKQVMNIIQTIFEKAAKDTNGNAALEPMRIRALLGAWVHDMGEMVVELATAEDVFRLTKEQQEAFSKTKNALEDELFQFGLRLASYAATQNTPSLFTNAIEAMRKAIEPLTDPQARIHALRTYINTYNQHALPSLSETPELKALRDAYTEAEESKAGNFLHPLVKSLECVEGQRYMQRNAQLVKTTELWLSTGHNILESHTRSERRLPLLYQEAGTDPAKRALARRTAQFVYRSLARPFLPHRHDYVSRAPEWVDRTDRTVEVDNVHLRESSLPIVRSATQRLLAERATKAKQGWDSPVLSRRQVGLLYRAAEHAVMEDAMPFIPQTPCLLRYDAEHPLPPDLKQRASMLNAHYPEVKPRAA